MLRKQRIASLRTILVAANAPERIAAPVQHETVVRIDTKPPQSQRLADTIRHISISVCHDGCSLIHERVLAAIPQMRIFDAEINRDPY